MWNWRSEVPFSLSPYICSIWTCKTHFFFLLSSSCCCWNLTRAHDRVSLPRLTSSSSSSSLSLSYSQLTYQTYAFKKRHTSRRRRRRRIWSYLLLLLNVVVVIIIICIICCYVIACAWEGRCESPSLCLWDSWGHPSAASTVHQTKPQQSWQAQVKATLLKIDLEQMDEWMNERERLERMEGPSEEIAKEQDREMGKGSRALWKDTLSLKEICLQCTWRLCHTWHTRNCLQAISALSDHKYPHPFPPVCEIHVQSHLIEVFVWGGGR